jgi:stage III sporulation protein AE
MKRKFAAIIAVLFLYLSMASFTYAEPVRADNSEAEKELADNVNDIVDNLDLAELEAYLATLSESQRAVIGTSGLKDRIKAVISGNLSDDYGSFLSYIASVLGVNIVNYLPIIVSVITIAVAYSLMSSLRGKFASDSVQNIVYFACVALLIVVLFTQIFSLIAAVRKTVTGLRNQMRITFPILLTLMTAVGAGSSVAVYKPGVAILIGGIAELITVFIIPAFIVSIVMTAVGNLSDGVKLGKLSGFFSNVSKWLLGTAFFVFTAFMAVQGITASVYDGVSVRTAKFAISKYVPVIGGYLSDGLNLVMSGSVLVKNAVGTTAIVLLFLSVIPTVVQILMLVLSLHFAGAVIEPLGDSRMSSLVSALAKNLTLLVSVVLAIAFLYFIFLLLIICTGNLAL